jgi:DNA-directed RNA polymerase subunit RPC12/RpoP
VPSDRDVKPQAEQNVELEWFMVTCDNCGWKWFESQQMQKKRFFYCPSCLSKVKNSYQPPEKKQVADDSKLESLKKFFDEKRIG